MKVRYLTDAEIDSVAIELLARFATKSGRQVEPPIPVDDIIEKYLGVTLEIMDLNVRLGKPDVLGAVYFDENVIRVDEGLLDQEGRLAFTMSHEVGHWQLHRPLYEMEKVTVRWCGHGPDMPNFVCRSSTKPPAEIQADKFAASLLMPERFVRDAFRTVHGGGPLYIPGLRERRSEGTTIGPWNELAKSVRSQGGFANVSVEAMRYRLASLNMVQDEESGRVQPILL